MNHTPKQLNILNYIQQYTQTNKYAPTLKEIATHFKVSSVTIYEHIQALQRKGTLTTRKHQARSIELNTPYTNTTQTQLHNIITWLEQQACSCDPLINHTCTIHQELRDKLNQTPDKPPDKPETTGNRSYNEVGGGIVGESGHQ